MSLQIWLPMNTIPFPPLLNYGILSKRVTNDVYKYVSQNKGKTGDSCATFSGKTYEALEFSNNIFQDMFPQTRNVDFFSVCFWYKPVTFYSTQDCLFIVHKSASSISDTNVYFYVGIQKSSGKLEFITRNKSKTLSSGQSTAVLSIGEWQHITLTFNVDRMSVYINGVLDSTHDSISAPYFYTATKAALGGFSHSSVSVNGCMNDFMFYDNYLTADEVRRVSQALVLKYSLDSKDIFAPNLITNMDAGGRTTVNGKYGLDANFGANQDTYGYFNLSPALELNKTYTLSFDVTALPNNSSWSWCLWNDADYSFTITKNGHQSFTFTPDSSKLPSGYSLSRFLFDDGSRVNPSGTVYFKNFKIEVGETDSSWCPHSTDSSYSSSNALKVLDSSGYNRHGKVTSSTCPIPSSNSVRYSGSYQFDGTDDYIVTSSDVTQSTILSDKKFTISAWVYLTDFREARGILGPHESSGTKGICFCQCNGSSNKMICSFGDGSSWHEIRDDTGYSLNTWTMYTMTYDGTTAKMYKNGTLVGSTTGSIVYSTSPFTIGRAYNGSNRYWKGKISDMKVYATALSADDIAKEYRNFTSVYSSDYYLCSYVNSFDFSEV